MLSVAETISIDAGSYFPTNSSSHDHASPRCYFKATIDLTMEFNLRASKSGTHQSRKAPELTLLHYTRKILAQAFFLRIFMH